MLDEFEASGEFTDRRGRRSHRGAAAVLALALASSALVGASASAQLPLEPQPGVIVGGAFHDAENTIGYLVPPASAMSTTEEGAPYVVDQCSSVNPPAADAVWFEDNTTRYVETNACSAYIQGIGDGSGNNIAWNGQAGWRWVAPDGTKIIAVNTWAALRDRDNQYTRVEVKEGGTATVFGSGTYNTNQGTFTWSGTGKGSFQGKIGCANGGSSCANPSSGRAYFQLKNVKLTIDDTTAPTIDYVAGDLLAGGEIYGTRFYGFGATDLGSGPRSSVVKVNGSSTNPQTYACELINASTARRLTACQTKNQQHTYSYDTTASPFQEGENTVEVCVEDFGADDVGNENCYSSSITVDNTPPETQIDSGPSGMVNETDATFSFSGTDAQSFECRLDPPVGAWQSCSSPWTEWNLEDGTHTWEVRAKDAQGRYDPSPPSRTWTVDTIKPETTITSGPSGASTERTATVTFSSSDAGASFECRIYETETVFARPDFKPCSSPHIYEELATTAYTVEVRAVDPGGNEDPSPASTSWVVAARLVPCVSAITEPSSLQPGDILVDGDIGVELPQVGEKVTIVVTTLLGVEELSVGQPTAGSYDIRSCGSETSSEVEASEEFEGQQDPPPEPGDNAPDESDDPEPPTEDPPPAPPDEHEQSAAAYAAETSSNTSPGPCRDKAYHLRGPKWYSKYSWRLNRVDVPTGVTRDQMEAAMKGGVTGITSSRNDCDIPDRVDALSEFDGYTDKTAQLIKPESEKNIACGGKGNGTSVSHFGALYAKALAVACTWDRYRSGQRNEFYESDVRFNLNDHSWTVFPGSSSCTTAYSIRGVATHEAGHSLGLLHVSERKHRNLTISPIINGPCQDSESTLGWGDIRGLRILY